MSREDSRSLHRIAEAQELAALALLDIACTLHELVPVPTPPSAVTAVLTVQAQGATMATATLNFVGPTGESEPAPTGDGSGLVVTFTSDGTATPGASTQGTDASGNVNYTADVAVVDDCSVSNITATVANTSGAPLLDNDGVTDFVQPPAFAFTAPAAPAPQATTATLTVS